MGEEVKEDRRVGELKRRFKNVRKRKRIRSGFECETVVLKMRLVKIADRGGQ